MLDFLTDDTTTTPTAARRKQFILQTPPDQPMLPLATGPDVRQPEIDGSLDALGPQQYAKPRASLLRAGEQTAKLPDVTDEQRRAEASRQQMMDLMQPAPRPKFGLKQALLTGAAGFLNGASQPNIAHGGGTDAMRAGLAGFQGGMGMMQGAQDRANAQRLQNAEIAQKAATAVWEGQRPETEYYKLLAQDKRAELARNEAVRNHDLLHTDRAGATDARTNTASASLAQKASDDKWKQNYQTAQANLDRVKAGFEPDLTQGGLSNGLLFHPSAITDRNQLSLQQRGSLDKAAADASGADARTANVKKQTSLLDAGLAVKQGTLQLARDKFNNEKDADSENGFSDDALNMMADQYFATGIAPSLGMGKTGTAARRQVYNRAAERHPDADIGSNRAVYDANKKSYSTLTGTLDSLTAFEKAGLKNLKKFTDSAAQIPDSGIPWANKPIRELDKNLVGDANMPVVEAARNIALREIARVTSNPRLVGTLGEKTQAEVKNLIPENATFETIRRVAKLLQDDMANVHESLADQKADLERRLKTVGPVGRAGQSAHPSVKPKPQQPNDGVPEYVRDATGRLVLKQ